MDLADGQQPGATEIFECNIYAKYKQRKGGFFGTDLNGYDGIPQNLVLNIIGWMIMILVFSVLRKKAWNYGRIALVQRTERRETGGTGRWTDRFLGNHAAGQLNSGVNEPSDQSPAPSATTQLIRGNTESPESAQLGNHSITHDYSRIVQNDGSVIMDTGYFSWLRIVFSLTDKQFLDKCGIDCVQYLSFQRHLIFLASIVTLTSLVIVLPINYQGTPESDQQVNFNQTTIINIKNEPRLLWVHVILAITFLFLSIAVMRHFSRGLKFVEEGEIRRSVMIVGIGKKFCIEDKLKRHFEEIYPDVELSEITFAYDISQLQSTEFSRQTARTAKIYWEDFVAKNSHRPLMRPYICGTVCPDACCCCCNSVDAIDYYTEEEIRYNREVQIEREKALTKPLGIAFLTFKTVDMAERVVSDYRFTAQVFCQTPSSKFSRKLKSKRWTVKFAPLPQDIYWENLACGLKAWYLKAFLVNVILALIITFYTTPVFLLQAIIPLLNINTTGINNSSHSINMTDIHSTASTLSGLLIDTIPTLLLWIVAVTLPSLVSVSDKIVGFWTKTAENRSRMIKVFSFLIFMVIILPSLGITSLTAIITHDLTEENSILRWECVFSKDNGALFVNYVCTSTFLGTASELMRLPELLVYSIKILFAKSSAEIAAIRQSVLWDFQIGSQYAWMMLNFAIFSVFSVIFPVVTPFGLVYLVFKHYVDRYNIYFAYGPTKVEKEVHGTAINFVIVCMFILQINLLAYVTTLGGTDSPSPKGEAKGLKVFSVVGFCITAALFISQIFFNMCANFSPILYRRISQDGLNLSAVTVRNGNGTASGQNPRPQPGTTSPYSRNKRPAENQYEIPTATAINMSTTGNSSNRKPTTVTDGEQEVIRIKKSPDDNLEHVCRPERRPGKYFPKILVTPQSRSVFPSPSPSVNSVNSNIKNGNTRNGSGPASAATLMTAVVVNEQSGVTQEFLLPPSSPKRPGTRTNV